MGPDTRPDKDSSHKFELPTPDERLSTSCTPAAGLKERIEFLFDKELVTAGTEYLPAVFEMHELESVNLGVEAVAKELTELGYQVETQYFAKVSSVEPPIATLIARAPSGDFAFPNFNLRLNPEIPRERGISTDPKKKYTVASTESDAAADERFLPGPAVERFPPSAEVLILIEKTDNPAAPYVLKPLYSESAFKLARHHAATASRGENDEYSYILQELALPAIATEKSQRTPLCGPHDVPETRDRGSPRSGVRLLVSSEFPAECNLPPARGRSLP